MDFSTKENILIQLYFNTLIMKLNRKHKMFFKLSFILIIIIYLENKYSLLSRTILKLNSGKGVSSKRTQANMNNF